MSTVVGRSTDPADPSAPVRRIGPLTETDPRHRTELQHLIAQDAIVNAVVDARVSAAGTLDPRHVGGTIFGARDMPGDLHAAVYLGGNLLPIGGTEPEWNALGRHLAGQRRRCTSIVGRAEAVHALWHVLRPEWGPGRAVRHDQPLLVRDTPPTGVAADPRLRSVRPDEAKLYLPAAAAMFAEELGISPGAGGHAAAYRQRIHRLVAESRALAVIDDGEVVFKADVGAVTASTCQVQGVWVRPDRRGQGLGTAAMAAALAHGLTLAPTVSLYVNDFNTPARRMYETLGMRQLATLATVLF